MKKILILLVCALLCTPIFANASFDETFSGPSLDESLWEYNAWNGARLNISSGAHFVGSNAMAGLQLTSRKVMTGDFTAELVFDNFSSTHSGPVQETPNIGFVLIGENGQEAPIYFSETTDDQGNIAGRGFVVMGRFEPCTNNSGSMIIERTGETVSLRYKDGDGTEKELSRFSFFSNTVTIRAEFLHGGGDNVTSYNATFERITVSGDTAYPQDVLIPDVWVNRVVNSKGRFTEFGISLRNTLEQPYCKPVVSVQALYNNVAEVDAEVFFEAWPYSMMNGEILDSGEVFFDRPMRNFSECTYGVFLDKNVSPRAGMYKMVIKRSDGKADISPAAVELKASDAVDLPIVDDKTIAGLSSAGGFSWQLPSDVSLADHIEFEIEPSNEYGSSKWTRYRIRRIPLTQNSIVLPEYILEQLKAATDYVRVRVRLRSPERRACSSSDFVLFKFDGSKRFKRTKAKKGGVVVIPL